MEMEMYERICEAARDPSKQTALSPELDAMWRSIAGLVWGGELAENIKFGQLTNDQISLNILDKLPELIKGNGDVHVQNALSPTGTTLVDALVTALQSIASIELDDERVDPNRLERQLDERAAQLHQRTAQLKADAQARNTATQRQKELKRGAEVKDDERIQALASQVKQRQEELSKMSEAQRAETAQELQELDLQEELTDLIEQLNAAQEALEALQRQLEELEDERREAQMVLDALESDIKIIEAAIADYTKEAERLEAKAANFEERAVAVEVAAEAAAVALETAARATCLLPGVAAALRCCAQIARFGGKLAAGILRYKALQLSSSAKSLHKLKANAQQRKTQMLGEVTKLKEKTARLEVEVAHAQARVSCRRNEVEGLKNTVRSKATTLKSCQVVVSGATSCTELAAVAIKKSNVDSVQTATQSAAQKATSRAWA